MTSSCVKVAGFAFADGRREVAREIGHRDAARAPPRAAAVDRVVHPRAALLARRARRGRGRTGRRARRPRSRISKKRTSGATSTCCASRIADAVERLDDAEKAGQHAILGKVLPHFLVGEGVARLLQLLRRVRDVPRFERRKAERVARERRQLGEVALGERLRAAGEIAQEGEHLARRRSPSSAPATARRSRDSPAAARLRGAARGCARSPACCPSRAAHRGRRRASHTRGAASARSARSCRVLHHRAGSTACAA